MIHLQMLPYDQNDIQASHPPLIYFFERFII